MKTLEQNVERVFSQKAFENVQTCLTNKGWKVNHNGENVEIPDSYELYMKFYNSETQVTFYLQMFSFGTMELYIKTKFREEYEYISYSIHNETLEGDDVYNYLSENFIKPAMADYKDELNALIASYQSNVEQMNKLFNI
jgi:hypothetical protein